MPIRVEACSLRSCRNPVHESSGKPSYLLSCFYQDVSPKLFFICNPNIFLSWCDIYVFLANNPETEKFITLTGKTDA